MLTSRTSPTRCAGDRVLRMHNQTLRERGRVPQAAEMRWHEIAKAPWEVVAVALRGWARRVHTPADTAPMQTPSSRCGDDRRDRARYSRYCHGVRWRSSIVGSIALSVAMLSMPARAADGPQRVAPTKRNGKQRRADRAARDFSRGGTERGGVEFGIAAAATIATGALIGRGIWELTQIDDTRRNCREGAVELACRSEDLGRGNKIAAGLSFGFAVPVGVAAGWLWARAVRTRRDHRAWHAAHPDAASFSVRPIASRRGGGLVLRGRF